MALILLYLSYPICLIHRFWNNDPLHQVSWIAFDKTVFQDFRWYLTYNELMLSGVFVILSFVITRTKTRKLQIVLKALLLVALVDIANYWLYFRRNEYVLFLEGLIMFVATILIFKNDSTRNKHEKAN